MVAAHIPITLSAADTQKQQQQLNFSDASTQTDLGITVNAEASAEAIGQQQTDDILVPEQHDSDIFVNADGTIDENEQLQQSKNTGGGASVSNVRSKYII